MKKKNARMSRMESSKEVRRVLNRNGVDLCYIQYMCTLSEMRLTGWLVHTDGSDFVPGQIEALMSDVAARLPGTMVFGDLENWSFSADHMKKLQSINALSSSDSVEEEDDYSEAG